MIKYILISKHPGNGDPTYVSRVMKSSFTGSSLLGISYSSNRKEAKIFTNKDLKKFFGSENPVAFKKEVIYDRPI